MSNLPEINVKRRRKGEEPLQRAEAPIRRPGAGSDSSSGGGSYVPGDGGGGGSYAPGGGGFNLPSKGKLGGGCGGLLVIILVVAYLLLGGGLGDNQGTDGADVSTQAAPNLANQVSNTPRPTRITSSSTDSDQKWLVMLYQDADDQALEQDIYMDLNESEKAGSSDRVTIVSQIDRFRGGFQEDGNWSSTRRYLLSQDPDLNRLNSRLVQDLGEVNMAAGESLVDFVTWAISTYPADRFVLIMSDHGMGWPGGWSDPTASGSGANQAPLSTRLDGDYLYLSELDEALAYLQDKNIVSKFDLIGLDACLMSQMEVYAALQPYADYAVASEETEPGLGWAYTAFLQALVQNPGMGGDQLAATIVDTYIQQDERIIDEGARSDFLRQGSQMGGFFGAQQVSAAQLARQLEINITLTAVDLKEYSNLVTTFNQFLYQLQSEDQTAVASAKNYAQSYTSIFGKEVPPSFIDLGNFSQLIARNGSSAVKQVSANLLEAINATIVAERHGNAKPGSTGIAIYFPNSTLYRSPYTGPQSYNVLAQRFVRISLWDEFLAFHYNDRSFDEKPVVQTGPSQGAISRVPGAGSISITEISKSANSVAPGETSQLSAVISGNNIGYAYLFTGLFDDSSNSILVADTDYLESPQSSSLNGVEYPLWPESNSFKINFEWEPIVFQINDGTNNILALFNPVSYGTTAEEAQYMVNGTYVFADSGETRRAQLYFRDGRLFQVLGYNGPQEAGAPTEITPAINDQFIVSHKWLELDADGSIKQVVYEDGDSITFGATPVTWEQVYAPAGQYLAGFLVSDLDGNLTQAYTRVTVK